MFRLLDPKAFETCFTRFMQRFAESLRGVVAVDGKTLRRSFDRITGKSPLHMVHAWSAEQRLLLGQVKVDDKSNEITAVPKLLELLSQGLHRHRRRAQLSARHSRQSARAGWRLCARTER